MKFVNYTVNKCYKMSSDSEFQCSPPEITAQDKTTVANLLSANSRERYEAIYRKFMDWRLKNKVQSFSENVLLAYFEELSNELKPSSLWAIYSMLRSTIVTHNNVNIADYSKLQAFLKRKSDGFQSKKSKILSASDIQTFLKNAPDDKYLFMKVVLVIGITGACRKQELKSLTLEDIEDTGKSLIITIRNSKNKTTRSFVVPETFYGICKKYMNTRPSGKGTEDLPFFLNYQKGKCTRQCVGINKFGSTPTKIAEYLGLSDPKEYTGHCFRRSSATILVDAGGDLLSLKRHGSWRSSTVVEGYVDNSLYNKTANSEKITSAIENMETENNTIVTTTSVFLENNCNTSSATVLLNNTEENNDKDEDDVSEEEDPLEGPNETKPEIGVDNSHNNVPNKPSPKRPSESSSTSSFLKKKKRPNEDSLRPRLYEMSATASSSYEDECNTFTKYVCSKLKQYTPEVRSRVQHEISTILLQADLGQFQSYHYNHPGISSNHIYNPPSQQQSIPSPEVNYESSDALSPETEQKLDFSDLIDS